MSEDKTTLNAEEVDAELLGTDQVRAMLPYLDFDNARFPIHGGLLQRRGGSARHDAVAWGFARCVVRSVGSLGRRCWRGPSPLMSPAVPPVTGDKSAADEWGRSR